MRLRDGDPEGAIALAAQVVERTTQLAQPLPMAVAHANLGHILDALGRFRAAEVSFQAAVALKRSHGFDNSLASTLNSLGVLYHHQGRLAEAEKTLAEAIRLAHENGAAVMHAYALSNLGDVQRDGGDVGGALESYQRSLAEKAELGSEFALAHTWNSMAALWRQQGDLVQAGELNERALALRHESADPIERLLYRLERGHIALAAGQFEVARTRAARGIG